MNTEILETRPGRLTSQTFYIRGGGGGLIKWCSCFYTSVYSRVVLIKGGGGGAFIKMFMFLYGRIFKGRAFVLSNALALRVKLIK